MKAGGISLISLITVLFCIGFYIPGCIDVKQNITSPLKKAADAPTVQLAEERLNHAIKTIEKRGLTKGSTHVLYRTDETDLGIWYNQLVETRNQLESVNPNSLTLLEESNLLMKVRETIVDQSDGDIVVTTPPRIITFPYHVPYAIVSFISFIALMIFGAIYIESY